jgi:hypothetical protein
VHVEAQRLEVAGQLGHGRRVGVPDRHLADAQDGPHAQRLELRLAAGTDERQAPGVRPGQVAGDHRRGRRRAQGGQQRHLGEEDRVAVGDVGQRTEGAHRLEAAGRVAGVPVDVLEGVGLAVAGGHQLDDAERGVAADPGDLVEGLPPPEVVLDVPGHPGDDPLRPGVGGPADHVAHVDEQRHVETLVMGDLHTQ